MGDFSFADQGVPVVSDNDCGDFSLANVVTDGDEVETCRERQNADMPDPLKRDPDDATMVTDHWGAMELQTSRHSL